MPLVTSVRLLPERIARAYRKNIELMDQRRNWHDITVTLCLCRRVNREGRCLFDLPSDKVVLGDEKAPARL